MHLRAALFDLDNTLHDKSATLRVVAARQYAEARLASLGVDDKEWSAVFVTLNNRRIEKTEVFSRLAHSFALPPPVQATLLADFNANLGASAVAFPGALELLSACKAQGLKIGVVTNGRDAFQRSKLDGMGLSPLIDVIVTSGAFGSKKPDPKIFLACLELLGTLPHEAVFVGDDVAADIQPALTLGMRAIFKSISTTPGAWLCTDELRTISALISSAAETT